VASENGVLVVDATNNIVQGMPAKNRRQVNEMLALALKSVKLNGKLITTPEIQKYLLPN